MIEYQNRKIFLLKDILQIVLKKILCLKKFKILFYGHILLMIAMVKTLFKHFIEKKHKKQMNKDLG